MRFSGKDYLHRTPGVIQDPTETGRIMKNEICPFVGGKTAGKPDGENRGVEHQAVCDKVTGFF